MEFRKIEGNEFSRLLPSERLSLLPFEVDIAADAQERAALAKRFGLIDIAALSARLHLSGTPRRGVIAVEGRIRAEVTQSCVVTLEPVAARIEEDFEAFFADVTEIEENDDWAEAALEGDHDQPEALLPEGLDLGELAAQQLAIALPAYPRSAQADSALSGIAAGEGDGRRPNPFHVLRALQERE
jgi:uncharacterized metal-binding protein YceD (DUF177 family)